MSVSERKVERRDNVMRTLYALKFASATIFAIFLVLTCFHGITVVNRFLEGLYDVIEEHQSHPCEK